MQLENANTNASNEAESLACLVGAVISRFSFEERFRLEENLVKMVIDKRPYYKSVKKKQVVEWTVSDLLDAIIQNCTPLCPSLKTQIENPNAIKLHPD